MAGPVGKPGKADAKAAARTPSGAKPAGDSRSATGAKAGRLGKNKDGTKNRLLGIALEPEVTCPFSVAPPTLRTCTVLIVTDSVESSPGKPPASSAEGDSADLISELSVSLEAIQNPALSETNSAEEVRLPQCLRHLSPVSVGTEERRTAGTAVFADRSA